MLLIIGFSASFIYHQRQKAIVDLKPTISRILFSVIAVIAFLIALNLFVGFFLSGWICGKCMVPSGCVDYEKYTILILYGGCHCSCTSLMTIIWEYIICVIIPFVAAYIIHPAIARAFKKKPKT
jgi:hypothetical protein